MHAVFLDFEEFDAYEATPDIAKSVKVEFDESLYKFELKRKV